MYTLWGGRKKKTWKSKKKMFVLNVSFNDVMSWEEIIGWEGGRKTNQYLFPYNNLKSIAAIVVLV